MALKIKPEHYAAISKALDAVSGDVAKAVPEYATKGLSNMRLRWDALRFARVNGDSMLWLCDTLYPYLNDAHIDSALRHYFKHSD